MLALVGIRFGDYLRDPGRVIEPYGDGFKAYTVIDYHAEYDSSYTHFQGMNYPYGDHAIPSATQPLISNAIKFISENLVDITDYTIAVVNLSMLVSIVLCGLFLFLIFRRMDLPWWYAGIAAAGITFLSPQIHRMHAHYGLSHPEVIPLLWYLLLRWYETRKAGTSLLVGLVVIGYSLIHFYYFAILVFAISFFFLFVFMQKWDWKGLPALAGHYLLQAVVPLLFFVYWLFMQDTVADRTPEPWGFFEFHAIWEGIATSMDQPYFQWIDRNLIKIESTGLEQRAYLGLVGLITLLAIGIHWVVRKFRGPVLAVENDSQAFLTLSFWVGLILLIFAHGVPFTLPGLAGLLDYAGPVRQFRSVGRFAWVFFYLMNIIAFVWLYEQSKEQRWRLLILVPALIILILEARNSSYGWNLEMDEVEEFRAGQSFLDLPGINYRDFQAILTVPYYNVGSDQFWWDPEGFILQKSLTLSIQTGLPVTSAMLTRSSRSQTLRQFQLVTEPYRLPVILEDYPDDRPLLMILDQREFEKERSRYEHLLEGADLIYSSGDRLRLYRLPLRTFRERLDNRIQKLERTIRRDSSLIRADGFAIRDSVSRVYYDDLAAGNSREAYFGKGAYQGTCAGENRFAIPNLPHQQAGQRYELSIWMYIADDRRTRSRVELIEFGPDGKELARHGDAAHHLIDLFDPEGWGLVELPFQAKRADSSFELMVTNPRLGQAELFLDELLVRPEGTEVYRQGEDYLWWNNRHYPISN